MEEYPLELKEEYLKLSNPIKELIRNYDQRLIIKLTRGPAIHSGIL